MDSFIKVSLVGQAWPDSEISKQHDYQRFANLIADYFRRIAPLDGVPKDARNISITVCDQIDHIHFLDSTQQLLIKI